MSLSQQGQLIATEGLRRAGERERSGLQNVDDVKNESERMMSEAIASRDEIADMSGKIRPAVNRREEEENATIQATSVAED